ncbi:MAG TPA: type II toxin-antitoxin system death-on-curing family toxin [Kiloniellales bacterium]
MTDTWLELSLVLAIHDAQLAEHGGAPGIRDPRLLDSALRRPRNLAHYGNPEPPELAAAYAWGLVRNHPFVDGNKRVAFVCMRTFLIDNGFDIVATQEDRIRIMERAAAGELTENHLATWIREHLVAVS